MRFAWSFLIVTFALLAAACSSDKPSDPTVRYNCGALPLTATVQGETLTLTFGTENQQQLKLKAARSASGARYTDTVTGAEFWSKGDEAQFSSDKFSLPLCLVEGSLPQQFSARGNEPFWMLAVDGNQATLRQPGDATTFSLSRAAPQQVAPLQTRLQLDNGWTLGIVESICYDSMSGQSYPYSAELQTDSETLQGCAGDPNRLLAGASWQVLGAPSGLTEQPALTFHSEQRVSGFAGCNYLNGQYMLSGEGMSFSPLAVTKRMCSPAAMAFENEFLRHLQGVIKVKVFNDKTMQLQLANGEYLQLQQVPLKLW